MKKLINEAFRLQQLAGLSPINNISEELTGGQSKLDANKNGKIDADDFKKIKGMEEGEDHEISMAQASLKAIISAASQLMNKLGIEEHNIPAWIQDHITNSENFIKQANQGFDEEYGNQEPEVQVAVMEKDEE